MKLISSIVILSCALLASSSHANPAPHSSIPVHKKINLNNASVEELTHVVKGIGHKRALAIVQYRQKHGLFKTLTDLASVRGIGLHFIQTHRSELDEKLIC